MIGTARAGWHAAWLTLMTELAPQSSSGKYTRPPSSLVAREPLPLLSLPAVLHVGAACPWCHRVTLTRALLGLNDASVRLTQLREDATQGGWVGLRNVCASAHLLCSSLFCAVSLTRVRLADEAAVPRFAGRATAPLLVDAAGWGVSNDSAQICRLLDSARLSGVTLRPGALVPAIDALNDRLYTDVNNAVYESGFSTSQGAYDAAQSRLWAALSDVERILSTSRFLLGDTITECDVRLFPTTVRLDAVYGPLFRCSSFRVADFPSLHAWMRDVYSLPGVAATVDLDACRRSYFGSLFPLNPSGIVPSGPTEMSLGLGRDPGRGEVGDAFAARESAAAAGVA